MSEISSALPADARAPRLALDGLRVAYPGRARPAVDGVDLHLQAGEIGCLLGESGCGKTTVLRAVAGFEPLQGGCVRVDGREVARAGAGLPPEARRVGMMFQDYALFPQLSAADNIAFGLRARPRAERAARVAQMLALVGLPDCADAYPHALSGGQQQRIALARALAPSPALLLLDEPFSNLDTDTRSRLVEDTRRVLGEAGVTALVVTHDQDEAFAIADRVGVMQAGRLLQWDTPEALYRRPASADVAGFVGRGEWLRSETLGLAPGERVRLRPGQLRIDPDGPLRAAVQSLRFVGPHFAARVGFASGETVELACMQAEGLAPGETLGLRLDASGLLRFPA